MCNDSCLWREMLYKATSSLISGLISGLIQWAYSVLYADSQFVFAEKRIN